MSHKLVLVNESGLSCNTESDDECNGTMIFLLVRHEFEAST